MTSRESEGSNDQISACFGESEITGEAKGYPETNNTNVRLRSPDESLREALLAAERFNARGFYKSGREILTPTLELAYALNLEIRNGGETAIQVALARLSQKRKRKISVNKVELIALELTAKPQTVSERKQCSSHASILKVAHDEGVSKEQFADWFREKKIKDCRRKAAKKAGSRAERQTESRLQSLSPSNPDEYPTLHIEIRSGAYVLAELTAQLVRMTGLEVRAQALLLESEQDVESILRQLAEYFESRARR
ncbi:hypothetical protein IYY11_11925 [Methylocystis sp. H62]|uniref:hypothetical protein n=1 Tax=Methylocystis sp. H62 TaxID=2785789 RepID=UPI0018C25F64|nr:hypothetical protein [Methylocystis sp. H62]MBG0794076.1 hypothetical protein [Methylocystis sp. H62]